MNGRSGEQREIGASGVCLLFFSWYHDIQDLLLIVLGIFGILGITPLQSFTIQNVLTH